MESKKVFVAGCGGLGCYIVEMLVRLGVGTVRVADGDVFSESNMNRQLYCTPDVLGKSKAVQAKLRWPEQVEAFHRFVGPENVSMLLSGCDLVIDALDNVEARRLLAEAASKAGIPLVYGAIGEKNAQACVLYPGDEDIIDILYPAEVQKYRTYSYVPAFCASLQVSLAHRILSGDRPEARTLLIADLDDVCLQAVKL